MIDRLIQGLLILVSLIILFKICRGNSCDYKTRIRVYCAVYHDEIFYVDTIRINVVNYIKSLGEGGEEPEIKIRYMSKLKYSLMREL